MNSTTCYRKDHTNLYSGSQENVSYQVQKLIFNLEHFKDFWCAYPDASSCSGKSSGRYILLF